MILSLQGCMGVGKTTALQYIEKNVPDVHISWEENRHVIEEVKRRGLQKTKYEDYLEIQKLWLENEVKRYEKAQLWECTMMDFGAEEIEFYTLNYPKTIGADWDVEHLLKKRAGCSEGVYAAANFIFRCFRRNFKKTERNRHYPFTGIF